MLGEPALDVEAVVLLGPQHAGQRLADDEGLLVRQPEAEQAGPKLVGLEPPRLHDLVEVGEGAGQRIGSPFPGPFGVGQSQPEDLAAAGRDH